MQGMWGGWESMLVKPMDSIPFFRSNLDEFLGLVLARRLYLCRRYTIAASPNPNSTRRQ